MSNNWKPLVVVSAVCLSGSALASNHERVSKVGVDSHLMPLVSELLSEDGERTEVAVIDNIPQAMIDRDIRVGISERKWTDFEVAQFESETGYRPTELYFTADVVAIIANSDNPNDKITIDEIKSAFTCSEELSPVRWGNWENDQKPVMQPYAVDQGLKRHHKFSQWVECGDGTYSATQFVADEEELFSKLESNAEAVSYATYSDRLDEYKLLSIVDKIGVTYDLNKETILSGRYPLSSVYYMYLDIPPHRNYLSDDEKRFVSLALEQEYKEAFNNFGFISLPDEAIHRNKVRLGLVEPIVEGGYK
ncbi:PstS family phosphate ABC transporter substrate-binding protein [Vibrio ouci]|uniref:Phosphate ABC transporter substrate-binding protein n=1 Tax=Vibrio ouci TaxID=2499078 RepID=A0A4Y8WHX6_9VIBR|nr:substrate-binding domain-containing protein [Vibrio ouci]TFH92419.1 phosphate ABC transporter substrate-binding protein [Vibrio ouci]